MARTTHWRQAITNPTLVGIFVFHEVEVLNFTGPFEVFSSTRLDEIRRPDAASPYQVVLIAERLDLIRATGGLKVQPDYTFEDCPPVDLLVVPGGSGTRQEMANDRLIAWIKTQAERGGIVASVCTGALLLAKAGLLDGKRATTHWQALDELRAASPAVTVVADENVVEDGDRITSAGIAAGIDMALRVVANREGETIARATARYMEYPFPENNQRRS